MDTRNARIGLILFSVYLVLYGGFVFLNAFSADTMEAAPIAGINVAILYGFGLIIAAIILSLIYGVICNREESLETTSTKDSASSEQEGSA